MTWDLLWLRDLAHQVPWWQTFLVLTFAFAAMYVGFTGATLLLTRRILPRWGVGQVIDQRTLLPGQIRGEVLRSLVSIVVFAGYGVGTLMAERAGVVAIRWQETPLGFLCDLALFFCWNELHFYLTHRLLHTRWLHRRVHVVHHR